MKFSTLATTALLLTAVSSYSLSAPVKFTYITTVTTPAFSDPTPGVSDGDTLTLEIIADNGRTGIISEQWKMEELLSAVVRVGSYEAHFNYPHWKPSWIENPFRTDTSGKPIGTWGDSDNNNTDNLGGIWSPRFSNNRMSTSLQTTLDYQRPFPNEQSWTITTIPLPAAAWLFGSAVLGLFGIARRK